MKFYIGLHQPADAHRFARCMVSINRLRDRRSDFPVGEWMLDSGAFTEITTHGDYREPVDVYATRITRWARCGQLVAAVAQDFMCEPFVLARVGRTVEEHQARTIGRYAALLACRPGAYLMPVLQGWAPRDYARHVRAYGALLAPGAWVGVGSVCKRNARPAAIEAVLDAIHGERPDLRLHGFGLKLTALTTAAVRDRLASADSMAWSYHARRNGRSGNDWHEAARYVERVRVQPVQTTLFPREVAA